MTICDDRSPIPANDELIYCREASALHFQAHDIDRAQHHVSAVKDFESLISSNDHPFLSCFQFVVHCGRLEERRWVGGNGRGTRIAAEAKADVEDARIALVAKAESATREVVERLATRIAAEAKADAETFSKLAVEAKADPSPSTGHSTDIYGHSQQYYHNQQECVAFLQDSLSDSKQFLGFPRHSDGKVIPNFAQPWSSDVIGD
jgi:hypothetical protein